MDCVHLATHEKDHNDSDGVGNTLVASASGPFLLHYTFHHEPKIGIHEFHHSLLQVNDEYGRCSNRNYRLILCARECEYGEG